MGSQKKTPKKGRGRPRKNSSVSERRIYVYADTKDQALKWKKYAKKAGISISSFISELLEDHINVQGTGEARNDLRRNILMLEEQNKKLRTENVNLSQQIERLNRLAERYEEELKKLKQGAWLKNGEFNGIRDYEQKLIDLLKEHKYIREEELLDLLHISPTNNNATKAIMKQLDNLLNYGFIKSHKGGYLWQG